MPYVWSECMLYCFCYICPQLFWYSNFLLLMWDTHIHTYTHTYIYIYILFFFNCCNLTKDTDWEITETEVGNEMKIFITLTKYNTHQQCEEGNPMLMGKYLASLLPHLTTVSNIFMRNGTYLLMFIGTIYNINQCRLFWDIIYFLLALYYGVVSVYVCFYIFVCVCVCVCVCVYVFAHI